MFAPTSPMASALCLKGGQKGCQKNIIYEFLANIRPLPNDRKPILISCIIDLVKVTDSSTISSLLC